MKSTKRNRFGRKSRDPDREQKTETTCEDAAIPHLLDRCGHGLLGAGLVTLLLLLNLGLALTSAARKSVTIDEYAWLPNGMAIVGANAFHIQSDTPPLGKIVPALAVANFTSAKFDHSTARNYDSAWACGHQFLRENPERFHEYFLVARVPSALVLLLTCGLSYLLSSQLYGRGGGLLTAACVCLSPNLLAHGRLATNDIYLALGVVMVALTLDRLLRRPTGLNAALLGVGLAVALLAKFTGVLVFLLTPVAIVVDLLWRRFDGSQHREEATEPDAASRTAMSQPSSRKLVAYGVLACALAIVLVNACYGFGGTFTQLGEFQFKSSAMQKIQGALPAWLPMPLPAHYVSGPDQQLGDSGYESYLLGEFRNSGFLTYYLVAFLVKTPVALLALGAAAGWAGGWPRRREAPLLLLGLLLFVFFSFAGHKNVGIRYLLFLIPLGCIFIGRIARSSHWMSARRARGSAVATGGLIVCLFAATLLQWPHYLPFFNIASGGPANGHLWLLDSNIDWGQDLLLLRDYMRDNEIDEVDLAYFGRVKPESYKIAHHDLVLERKNRYAVISANLLWGRRYYVNGSAYWLEDRNHYAAYRTQTPIAVLGHSLYVFDQGERNGQPMR